MEEGTLTVWHKKIGDYVDKREHLFDVETDKTTMEVESVDSGYLCEILFPEGDTAPVGAVIAVLAESKEEC
jgi:pyruvate/2-oxoglutarate dehydrogenase complex dihydrolipoamide acyltransferase (E2) component